MKTKKRKNKKSKTQLQTELFNKYSKVFQTEFDKTLRKAWDMWDIIVIDWMSPYDLVLESMVKDYVKWWRFFLDKWLNFVNLIETYQQYSYDKFWMLPAWMFSHCRAEWYNIMKPWENRKWTEYFKLSLEWLPPKWLENAKKLLARINK